MYSAKLAGCSDHIPATTSVGNPEWWLMSMRGVRAAVSANLLRIKNSGTWRRTSPSMSTSPASANCMTRMEVTILEMDPTRYTVLGVVGVLADSSA